MLLYTSIWQHAKKPLINSSSYSLFYIAEYFHGFL